MSRPSNLRMAYHFVQIAACRLGDFVKKKVFFLTVLRLEIIQVLKGCRGSLRALQKCGRHDNGDLLLLLQDRVA